MIGPPVPVALPVPRATLGEGPCYDPATGALYWVDIPACRVHERAADGAVRSWDVGQPVGAVVVRARGGLVLAARDGFLALDLVSDAARASDTASRWPRSGGSPSGASGPVSDAITPLAPLGLPPGVRMNDGACDAAGRFLAGSMADDESPGCGTLYRLDPDHAVAELIAGVTISNGIGWSPDGTLMYYIDSPTRRVDVLDYDPVTGAISDRRTFAAIDAGDAMPDGLAVDAEGGVWVALWDGGAVLRFAPDGRLRQAVDLPCPRVTSCAFGGPDLATLYITTAAGPGDQGGELFRVPAGVAGLSASPYAG